MGRTKLGSEKAAASRIGCTWQEYVEKRQSGFKWCSVCKTWVLLAFFAKRSAAIDGKSNNCKSCAQTRHRQRYKPVPLDRRKPSGRAACPPRDGDKKQAFHRVNREVCKSKLPHARTVSCTDCGHIGSDRRHVYDHYLGYAAINHLDVQCVCFPCYRKRELQRRQQEKVNVLELSKNEYARSKD